MYLNCLTLPDQVMPLKDLQLCPWICKCPFILKVRVRRIANKYGHIWKYFVLVGMSIYTYLSVIYLSLLYAKIKQNSETEFTVIRMETSLELWGIWLKSTAAKGNVNLHRKQTYNHRGVGTHLRKLIPNSFSNPFLLLPTVFRLFKEIQEIPPFGGNSMW